MTTFIINLFNTHESLYFFLISIWINQHKINLEVIIVVKLMLDVLKFDYF